MRMYIHENTDMVLGQYQSDKRIRQYWVLTDGDVLEPVEWSVGCTDCHSYTMSFLTTV